MPRRKTSSPKAPSPPPPLPEMVVPPMPPIDLAHVYSEPPGGWGTTIASDATDWPPTSTYPLEFESTPVGEFAEGIAMFLTSDDAIRADTPYFKTLSRAITRAVYPVATELLSIRWVIAKNAQTQANTQAQLKRTVQALYQNHWSVKSECAAREVSEEALQSKLAKVAETVDYIVQMSNIRHSAEVANKKETDRRVEALGDRLARLEDRLARLEPQTQNPSASTVEEEAAVDMDNSKIAGEEVAVPACPEIEPHPKRMDACSPMMDEQTTAAASHQIAARNSKMDAHTTAGSLVRSVSAPVLGTFSLSGIAGVLEIAQEEAKKARPPRFRPTSQPPAWSTAWRPPVPIQASPPPEMVQAWLPPVLIQASPPPEMVQAWLPPVPIQAPPSPEMVQAWELLPVPIQAPPPPEMVQAPVPIQVPPPPGMVLRHHGGGLTPMVQTVDLDLYTPIAHDGGPGDVERQ